MVRLAIECAARDEVMDMRVVGGVRPQVWSTPKNPGVSAPRCFGSAASRLIAPAEASNSAP